MSPIGTFRTSYPCLVMSAYEGEAEVFKKLRHFRYWPQADLPPQSSLCPLLREDWRSSDPTRAPSLMARAIAKSWGASLVGCARTSRCCSLTQTRCPRRVHSRGNCPESSKAG